MISTTQYMMNLKKHSNNILKNKIDQRKYIITFSFFGVKNS